MPVASVDGFLPGLKSLQVSEGECSWPIHTLAYGTGPVLPTSRGRSVGPIDRPVNVPYILPVDGISFGATFFAPYIRGHFL